MTSDAKKRQDDAAIQGLLDDFIEALHDKNLDGVMSIYAPEVMAFAIGGPLQYRGADAVRKVWAAAFPMFREPITYAIRDLDLTVDDVFLGEVSHISPSPTLPCPFLNEGEMV